MTKRMKNNRRDLFRSCLLCLGVLFGASKAMPLSQELSPNLQQCKDVSQEIIQQLWNLSVKSLEEKASFNLTFPQKITCGDHCDPDSLRNNNMNCLKKIQEGLHGYYDLLTLISNPSSPELDPITNLKSALNKLLRHLKVENTKTRYTEQAEIWQQPLLRNNLLWRLQSFFTVAARVFAYSATLNGNAKS